MTFQASALNTSVNAPEAPTRIGSYAARPEAAESMAKLHPKLSASGIEHTVTIEEPPVDSSRDDQLPLS